MKFHKEQFSIDFLASPESRANASRATVKPAVRQAAPGLQQESLENALLVYSQPILTFLRERPGRRARAQELVRTLAEAQEQSPSYSEFLNVLDGLEKMSIVDIQRDELTGNHNVTLR